MITATLDDSESLSRKAGSSKTARLRFERKVRGVWRLARKHEGVGEFGKILKRLYRLAGLARLGFLRGRTANDILEDPSLVRRVADYYRCTGSVEDYLDFIGHLIHHPEQVYPDVNVALTESLLRLEPNANELSRIRLLTRSLAVATLLALRFGNAAIRRVLKKIFEETRGSVPRQVVRAAAFIYASESSDAYKKVAKAASTKLRNHLSTLVRLIAEIRKYATVPHRYKNRLALSSDTVAGRKVMDTRVVLTARLLLLSPNGNVRQ